MTHPTHGFCSGSRGIFVCVSVCLAAFVIFGMVGIVVYLCCSRKKEPESHRSPKKKLKSDRSQRKDKVNNWLNKSNAPSETEISKISASPVAPRPRARSESESWSHPTPYQRRSTSIERQYNAMETGFQTGYQLKNDKVKRTKSWTFVKPKDRSAQKSRNLGTPRQPPVSTHKSPSKRPVNDDCYRTDYFTDMNCILDRQVYLEELGRHILQGGDPDLFREHHNNKQHRAVPNANKFRYRRSDATSPPRLNHTYSTPHDEAALDQHSKSPSPAPKKKDLELEVQKALNPRTVRASLAEMATEIDGLYQFHITGDQPSSWCVDMRGDSAVFRHGTFPDPDVTFTLDYDLAVKVMERQVKVWPQVVTRRIQWEGDRKKLYQFKDFLKKMAEHYKQDGDDLYTRR